MIKCLLTNVFLCKKKNWLLLVDFVYLNASLYVLVRVFRTRQCYVIILFWYSCSFEVPLLTISLFLMHRDNNAVKSFICLYKNTYKVQLWKQNIELNISISYWNSTAIGTFLLKIQLKIIKKDTTKRKTDKYIVFIFRWNIE